MTSKILALLGPLLLVLFLPGCPADGIGDPCVPEDEYSPTFSGFALTVVSTESRSFSCQSRLCLINRFQGRVSCPYGQKGNGADGGRCNLPGSEEPVRVPVSPQLLDRRPETAVYCSCRCDGPDPNARYCECPSGFTCSEAIPELSLGRAQLPGSYCLRNGTEFVGSRVQTSATCSAEAANCQDGE